MHSTEPTYSSAARTRRERSFRGPSVGWARRWAMASKACVNRLQKEYRALLKARRYLPALRLLSDLLLVVQC